MRWHKNIKNIASRDTQNLPHTWHVNLMKSSNILPPQIKFKLVRKSREQRYLSKSMRWKLDEALAHGNREEGKPGNVLYLYPPGPPDTQFKIHNYSASDDISTVSIKSKSNNWQHNLFTNSPLFSVWYCHIYLLAWGGLRRYGGKKSMHCGLVFWVCLSLVQHVKLPPIHNEHHPLLVLDYVQKNM